MRTRHESVSQIRRSDFRAQSEIFIGFLRIALLLDLRQKTGDPPFGREFAVVLACYGITARILKSQSASPLDISERDRRHFRDILLERSPEPAAAVIFQIMVNRVMDAARERTGNNQIVPL